MEIWKDVVGYEGLYQVSSHGRVKSLEKDVTCGRGGLQRRKAKIKNSRIDRYGYEKVTLCKDGVKKSHTVHRLVADAFIKNPNNLPSINHIDENKLNNHHTNLEYCTVKYNNQYGDRGKHISQALKGHSCSEQTKNKIRDIKLKKVLCVELGKTMTTEEAAQQYRVSRGAITFAAKHDRVSCGYHWKYI